MDFCGSCKNLMLFRWNEAEGRVIHACRTCKLEKPLDQPVIYSHYPKPKNVDDILGGQDAWSNVSTTEARCPKCDNNTAHFLQLQTRSADEPMTTYYKCTKCQNRWKV